MEYRIEQLADIKVTGLSRHYKSMAEGQRNIAQFWSQFNEAGQMKQLKSLMNDQLQGFLGLCIVADQEMDYMIAVSSDECPVGFEQCNIPAGRYLVFKAEGPVPEAIQHKMEQIHHWLPGSSFAVRPAPMFERYIKEDTSASDYLTELFIPVQ